MNKNLNLNELFLFDELPPAVQNDFLIQIENNFEISPYDFVFHLQKINYKELLRKYDLLLGPNLLDEIEDDYVVKLAEDISKNGMKNPPIGREGNHRSLAHIYLQKDMMYFEIINLIDGGNQV